MPLDFHLELNPGLHFSLLLDSLESRLPSRSSGAAELLASLRHGGGIPSTGGAGGQGHTFERQLN